MLSGGPGWYDHLSEYFCHGEANWKGPSWRGGVTSMDTIHELTCADMMGYLAVQVSNMNSYASLCPVEGNVDFDRAMAVQVRRREVRKPTQLFGAPLVCRTRATKRAKPEMVRNSDVEVTVEVVKELLDVLGELARIHLVIDAPTRSIGPEEPDWIAAYGRSASMCARQEVWKLALRQRTLWPRS